MTTQQTWVAKAGRGVRATADRLRQAGATAATTITNTTGPLGQKIGSTVSVLKTSSKATLHSAGKLSKRSLAHAKKRLPSVNATQAKEATTHESDDLGFDPRNMPGAGTRAFWIGLVVVCLALVSGLATYLILTGLTPIVPRSDVVITVLFINLVLVVAMIAILSWQAYGLVRAWRHKVAGARLHVRIVLLFSVIAALPAILLAVSATTTFSRSLDNLFSRSTRNIVARSLNVANAYLHEHGQVIRTDIVNMTKDLDDVTLTIGDDLTALAGQLLAQAGLRQLPIALIIDAKGKVIVTGVDDVKVPYVRPGPRVIQEAQAGRVPLLLPKGTYRVAAVTKLKNLPGRYLYVARRVNPLVIRQVRATTIGVRKFRQLRKRRGGMKLAHGLMYFMISLTALLAAIWVGMWFAGRLVAPIRRLIGAAQQVSTGNMNVRLPLKRGEGDLRRLSQTFNHMTSKLKSQRDALVSVNEQLDERRLFMEAMLSGVTAGVIGLDKHQIITLANRSAVTLLGHSEDDLIGRTLADAVPQFAELISASRANTQNLFAESQKQVKVEVAGVERTFSVRSTQERAGDDDQGWVVTFDDVTELVAAQRTSAWADVAQRIAHEIKNPLTPIQLSAERIRRKYGKVITQDREVFDKCTETIIRQVGDVAAMVDEFSSFARMPKPEMALCDLRKVVRDPVDLFEMGNSHIKFTVSAPLEEVLVKCDRRLISRVVTNLVKNASEAIAAVSQAKHKPSVGALRSDFPRNETSSRLAATKADKPPRPDAKYQGHIHVVMSRRPDHAVLEVIDNGIGLPKQNRGRLIEPYVTHREKGTGLGLAIVQKIIEQHGGTLGLEDAPLTSERQSGALMRMVLPIARPEAKTKRADKADKADRSGLSGQRGKRENVADDKQTTKLNPTLPNPITDSASQ